MERQGNGQPEEQEKTTGRASGQTAFEGVSEAANGKATCQEQEDNQDELERQGSEAGEGVEEAEHDEQDDQKTSDELALVRAQLVAQEALAKEKDDLLLRERAELENFKRRMQREKSESLRFASEPLLRDILPVIDNLERAVAHAKGNEGSQALVEGVELVLRSLLDTIGRHGVSRVKAKGEAFDPSRHEAVAQVENTELAPNTVLDEHQSGYQLHDRLLRPAMVSVSKAAPQAQQEGEEESES